MKDEAIWRKKEERLIELEGLLADPSVAADKDRYPPLAREYAEWTQPVARYRSLRKIRSQIDETRRLLEEGGDAEMRQLAQEELRSLTERAEEIEKELEDFLRRDAQVEDKDVIIEIRAGTGGQEASLFAADLYRMYGKYAERRGWRVEPISSHPSETGGFKEVVFSVSGPEASRRLRWESGVHRVQRVPVTETSGRIHTSAATVAVLFEPDPVEVVVDPRDLKIDVFRSSGPGGQSVNTTDSAIRITHLPTGMVVVCQDERSQLKNKNKAMRVLRARLYDALQRERQAAETDARRVQVGSGDRSEKIRTYNFPDRRVTDHRIGFTSHRLPEILDGELDELTDALLAAEAAAGREDA